MTINTQNKTIWGGQGSCTDYKGVEEERGQDRRANAILSSEDAFSTVLTGVQ